MCSSPLLNGGNLLVVCLDLLQQSLSLLLWSLLVPSLATRHDDGLPRTAADEDEMPTRWTMGIATSALTHTHTPNVHMPLAKPVGYTQKQLQLTSCLTSDEATSSCSMLILLVSESRVSCLSFSSCIARYQYHISLAKGAWLTCSSLRPSSWSCR